MRRPPLLLMATAVVLSACGGESKTASPPTVAGSTLFIRAEGMVQSLGIT